MIVRIFKIRLKFWMFKHATENFKLMEMNGDCPVPIQYQYQSMYFLPIRRTRKCLFGVITFTHETTRKLYRWAIRTPYGLNASFHTHYNGKIFETEKCWAGLIPLSAFSSHEDVTEEFQENMETIAERVELPFPILRDHLDLEVETGRGYSSQELPKEDCDIAFTIRPKSRGIDFDFSVSIKCNDDEFVSHFLDVLSDQYDIYPWRDGEGATFKSVGDYESVRADYDDDLSKRWNDCIYNISFSWDVPKDFSLESIMTYPETEEREFDYDFDWKTVPFSYQEEAIEFGLSHDRFLLCDSQGLGKTLESATIASVRKQQLHYEHCLIVCCVNTLKWNWVNEIKTHTFESAHVLGSFVKKDGSIGYDTKKRISDLESIDELPYFIITNIEFLRDKTAVDKLVSLINDKKINMVIADEIHKCKNPQASQTKGLFKLQPECKIAMTGTPIMNNPTDVYSYLRWLGYEKHTYSMFRNFFIDGKGRLRNLSILDRNIDKIMLRRTKEDVLDLPPKTYEDQIVELSDEHQAMYKGIRSDVAEEIDDMDENDNPLTRLLHLRQCTLDPCLIDEDAGYSEKFERALDLIQNAFSGNESVVVFCSWKQPLYDFKEFLSKGGIDCKMITGDTNDCERMELVEAFQNNPEPEVMIGTTGAMGTGITLTKATTVIFLDEPWTDAAKEQAVDRCYRIGTKSHVTIYTLMAKDTIDERIHELLFYKRNVSSAIIDKKTEARFLLGENGLLEEEEKNDD